MFHEHWRSAIESHNPAVEETQDIAWNEHAFHDVLTLKIAKAHDQKATVDIVSPVLRHGHNAFCNETERMGS